VNSVRGSRQNKLGDVNVQALAPMFAPLDDAIIDVTQMLAQPVYCSGPLGIETVLIIVLVLPLASLLPSAAGLNALFSSEARKSTGLA
jgi:hypothetical protein